MGHLTPGVRDIQSATSRSCPTASLVALVRITLSRCSTKHGPRYLALACLLLFVIDLRATDLSIRERLQNRTATRDNLDRAPALRDGSGPAIPLSNAPRPGTDRLSATYGEGHAHNSTDLISLWVGNFSSESRPVRSLDRDGQILR